MSTCRAAVLRGALAAAAVALLACLVSLPVAGANSPGPVCGLWYGIGDTPTPEEIELAAERYQVVVLNAWETDTLHRLHTLNPDTTVLVYKDLSSTRSYPGAVTGDTDADHIPTGIGYYTAQRDHPEWFALDTHGDRIEWDGYPQHWQMTVWNPDYQRAWAAAVTDEAVRAGWDGVFADNDFAHLDFYSSALLAGTTTPDATDQTIRDGLDDLVTTAGTHLAAADKLLVPNISEARLFPGRWQSHARYGGAMEEYFAYFPGQILTDQGGTSSWTAQTSQPATPGGLALLVTRSSNLQVQRYAFASAAIRSGGRTCWTAPTTEDYSQPEWSIYQDVPFGAATGPAMREPFGAWTRSFDNGWMAVNPTGTALFLEPPAGLRLLDGTPVDSVTLQAGDAVLLVR